MSTINDGGPAFPRHGYPQYGGMTLRDYFAAKAMAACITALADGSGLPVVINDCRLAERSYEIADAILEARK